MSAARPRRASRPRRQRLLELDGRPAIDAALPPAGAAGRLAGEAGRAPVRRAAARPSQAEIARRVPGAESRGDRRNAGRLVVCRRAPDEPLYFVPAEAHAAPGGRKRCCGASARPPARSRVSASISIALRAFVRSTHAGIDTAYISSAFARPADHRFFGNAENRPLRADTCSHTPASGPDLRRGPAGSAGAGVYPVARPGKEPPSEDMIGSRNPKRHVAAPQERRPPGTAVRSRPGPAHRAGDRRKPAAPAGAVSRDRCPRRHRPEEGWSLARTAAAAVPASEGEAVPGRNGRRGAWLRRRCATSWRSRRGERARAGRRPRRGQPPPGHRRRRCQEDHFPDRTWRGRPQTGAG